MGQRCELRPAAFFTIKMQHGFAVAMQVEHVIGVKGQQQQLAAQAG
jgi:hypothetical protein